MTTIDRNAVRCLKCNAIAESKHRHQMVSCACSHVSVDGGLAYRRRVWRGEPSWMELDAAGNETPREAPAERPPVTLDAIRESGRQALDAMAADDDFAALIRSAGERLGKLSPALASEVAKYANATGPIDPVSR